MQFAPTLGVYYVERLAEWRAFTFVFMDNMDTGSAPRGTSLFLIGCTLMANWLHSVTHAEINLWIATAAGLLSIDHYVGFGIASKTRSRANKIVNYFKRLFL